MRELPHDGETASIVRGGKRGTFYLFNAGLVHVYVRTAGNFLVTPQLDLPNCNFKSLNSERVNCSMKSSGNLSRFLDTALYRALREHNVTAIVLMNPAGLASNRDGGGDA